MQFLESNLSCYISTMLKVCIVMYNGFKILLPRKSFITPIKDLLVLIVGSFRTQGSVVLVRTEEDQIPHRNLSTAVRNLCWMLNCCTVNITVQTTTTFEQWLIYYSRLSKKGKLWKLKNFQRQRLKRATIEMESFLFK